MTGRKGDNPIGIHSEIYGTRISVADSVAILEFASKDNVLMNAISSGKDETDIPMEGSSSASLGTWINNEIVFQRLQGRLRLATYRWLSMTGHSAQSIEAVDQRSAQCCIQDSSGLRRFRLNTGTALKFHIEAYCRMNSWAMVRMCCTVDMGRPNYLRNALSVSSLLGSERSWHGDWETGERWSWLYRLRVGSSGVIENRRCIRDLGGVWYGGDHAG
jgi:hypothetical protein